MLYYRMYGMCMFTAKQRTNGHGQTLKTMFWSACLDIDVAMFVQSISQPLILG